MGAPFTLLAFVAALLTVNACPYAGESGAEVAPVDMQHRSLSAVAPSNCGASKPSLVDGIKVLYGTDGIAQAKICFAAARDYASSHWDKKFAGQVLRMSFHDCGEYGSDSDHAGHPRQPSPYADQVNCGGCNGSFYKEQLAGKASGFSKYPQQDGMQDAWNLLDQTQKYVTKQVHGCGNMSYADISTILGLVAVSKAGGSPGGGCHWHPGRRDAWTVGGYDFDDSSLLPGKDLGDQGLIDKFTDYGMKKTADDLFGMSIEEAVAMMSSAHTIGNALVTGVDATSMGKGAMSSTPDLFDGSYFAEVISFTGYKGMNGWFAADRAGLCSSLPGDNSDPNLRLKDRICAKADSQLYYWYKKYADLYNGPNKDGDATFKKSFCNAYQAMSTIGYQVPTKDEYLRVASEFYV